MKIRSTVKFKAVFLTIVFLLNTIVGFACAIGMDMVFNSGHHKVQKVILASEHIHEHDKTETDHHSSKGSKDNCCKDEFAKIIKAEKMAQRSFDYNLLSMSFFDLPARAYFIGGLTTSPVNTLNAHFLRHCRSPISDLRIAIQSFQI